MKVEIAEHSGYCFGVKRALKLAREALGKKNVENKKIYTLGSIIHNPGVVQELSGKGLVSVKDIKDIEEGSIFVVRSHGMSPTILKELKKKNINIIDATCPFVKKAHKRTQKLAADGFYVILIGDNDHPEVCGIKDQVDKSLISVINNKKDLMSFDRKPKIGVVIQTTQTMEKLKELACELLDKTLELYVVNTICDTTKNRQNAVRELSERVDIMLVVGGKNSANTTHLADIARQKNPNTYHIENKDGLVKDWFKNMDTVGISGGASTPEEDILEIRKKIEDMKF
jgi:4-hydroxy-3-methylbut-2-enyl diphosphate reductase